MKCNKQEWERERESGGQQKVMQRLIPAMLTTMISHHTLDLFRSFSSVLKMYTATVWNGAVSVEGIP